MTDISHVGHGRLHPLEACGLIGDHSGQAASTRLPAMSAVFMSSCRSRVRDLFQLRKSDSVRPNDELVGG